MPPRRIGAPRPTRCSSRPEKRRTPPAPPAGDRAPAERGLPAVEDPSEPGRALFGVGPAPAGRQARHRVSAAFPAPAPAAHAHQPVQVVTAVRAPIRPAAVQRAEHPLLLAVGQSHGYLPPRPVSTRRPRPQMPCCALSAGRLGQRTTPICAGKSQLIVCVLQNFIHVNQRNLYTLCLPSGPLIVPTLRPISKPLHNLCPPHHPTPSDSG
jgi:hypothetical protein